MAIDIRVATSPDELHAVYRFRYQIYVQEMKRPQANADHNARTIIDALDATAFVIAAFDGADVIGTLRLNFMRDTHCPQYVDWYRMREFPGYYPERVSISTRLMLAQSYRRTRVARQLHVFTYLQGASAGMCFDFMDCNPHLVRYFNKLGYRQLFPRFQHHEYGEVVPMVLAGLDIDYLDQIDSPFCEVAPRGRGLGRDPSVNAFYNVVGRTPADSTWSVNQGAYNQVVQAGDSVELPDDTMRRPSSA